MDIAHAALHENDGDKNINLFANIIQSPPRMLESVYFFT